jgi:L-ascorbate metabolism protein UlaG (beta-lactamase superfamily)
MKYKNINIEWLGHDSFRIKYKNKTIYIDPFKINTNETADIILITHSHYDHYSKEDIEKINHNSTIIGPNDIKREITKLLPGEKTQIDNITIEAFPSYNQDKPFHPKENNWLGFVININKTRIYHAGDTDLIPEMSNLKNIDIALLPVSGKYVMNAEEAAKAAKIINAEISIPMHYGEIIGNKEDAEKFKSLCPSKVIILEKC